ncbi:MAG: hypothetical protein E7313_00550 [Clostridiales bacterium]|nr:hypothetical protein [Clostridiales bacterium]
MNRKQKKGSSELKWFVIIFVLSFVLSIIFSFISTSAIDGLSIMPAVLILFFVIFMGIVFDIIGVAVTVAKESDFNAKAAKKISGSKTSLKLIRNSAKVSNVCADVIGDIAGVLSGSISALISMKITSSFNLSFDIQFIISAIVASLTIGGKAIGKGIAQRNSTKIVGIVGKVLKVFNKERKNIVK